MEEANRPVRVLLVEDSLTQARILQRILTSNGFEVEVAHDGPAGYERYTKAKFDVVISDVIMPGISGYELCKRIKLKGNGTATPVILVTALNELKDLIDGLRSGADNFISKPVNPEFLIARIKSVLLKESENSPELCDPETGLCFLEPSFIKSLDRKRILDYLVSTFDDFLRLRESQSQKKLAEAQRYFRLVKQQETRATKLAHEIASVLQAQDDSINALLNHDEAKIDRESHDTVAGIKRRNQLLKHLVNLMAALFSELETVAAEQ